jgi:hypothetical protein
MIDENDDTTRTGQRAWWPKIRYCDEAGGALDAPGWIAAGYMGPIGECMGAAVLRDGEQ